MPWPRSLWLHAVLCLRQLSLVAGSSMGSCSVTTNPSHTFAGTTVNSVTFAMSVVVPLAATDYVTVTASSAMWATTGTMSTCTVTISGSSDTAVFAGGITAQSTTEFRATVAASQSVVTGSPLTFTCTDNLSPIAEAGTTVTFSMVSTKDTTPVTGISGWISYLAGAGNDPISWFGDRRVEFDLEPNVLTTLLATDDFIMQGSVFQGTSWNQKTRSWEQWFDRIIIRTPGSSGLTKVQDRFLEIKMKKNLHLLNMSDVPKSDFYTLDLSMGYGDFTSKVTTDLRILPYWLLESQISIHRFSGASFRAHAIGNVPCECVTMYGRLMELAVCSRPGDYQHGRLRQLSMMHAHLDIIVFSIKDSESFRGLLPELWGLQPMSASTKSYVKQRPQDDRCITADAAV